MELDVTQIKLQKGAFKFIKNYAVKGRVWFHVEQNKQMFALLLLSAFCRIGNAFFNSQIENVNCVLPLCSFFGVSGLW